MERNKKLPCDRNCGACREQEDHDLDCACHYSLIYDPNECDCSKKVFYQEEEINDGN